MSRHKLNQAPVHCTRNMSQQEIFRSQAPAPLQPRPISIPTPRETVLSNGLTLVVVEDSRLPLVSYRLAFRVGGAFDPPALPGLTDLLAGLLPEGTESKTSKEIADEVARMGASLSAGANSDYTIVAASALSQFNDPVLDLMAEIILEPSFPEHEVELAKQNTKESLRQQRAQPSFLATGDGFASNVWRSSVFRSCANAGVDRSHLARRVRQVSPRKARSEQCCLHRGWRRSL